MKPLEKPLVFEFFCDSAKKLHKAFAGSRTNRRKCVICPCFSVTVTSVVASCVALSRWVTDASPPAVVVFLPVKVLGRVFRGKLLALLRQTHDSDGLRWTGGLSHLAQPGALARFDTSCLRWTSPVFRLISRDSAVRRRE